MDYYRIKAGIPAVPGTEYGGPFSAYDPGGLPAQTETRYGSGLGNPIAAGAGVIAALETLFPTDEDAEIAALTDPTTDDFRDGLSPPKKTGGGATTPATYKPPTGGGNVPPAPAPPVASSGGLSTGAMVGIGVVSVVLVGGLVWAKKTGKLGGKSGKRRLAP